MICQKCGQPMYCYNTRQKDEENVRYRGYVCKNCGERMYTIETVTDFAYGRKKANQIHAEAKLRDSYYG